MGPLKKFSSCPGQKPHLFNGLLLLEKNTARVAENAKRELENSFDKGG